MERKKIINTFNPYFTVLNNANLTRLLLPAFIFLLFINLVTLYFVFRPVNSNEIKSLKRVQLQLDSLSARLDVSHRRIDTVLGNINHTLELSRQLDEQVITLSTGYEKDRVMARKKLQSLKEQIRNENEKLKSLQHELKQL